MQSEKARSAGSQRAILLVSVNSSTRSSASLRSSRSEIKVEPPLAFTLRICNTTVETIEFMLSPKRDLVVGEAVLALGTLRRKSAAASHQCRWPSDVSHRDCRTERSGELGRRCRCRTAPYLNNIIEQDHRFIKKRIHRQRRIPVCGRRVQNDCRLRSDAYDSQRPGPLGRQGRSDRPARGQISARGH